MISSNPLPARARPEASTPWLTYREAAAYTGWSVPYLRNLVSAGQIPAYGKPRVRRFRRDKIASIVAIRLQNLRFRKAAARTVEDHADNGYVVCRWAPRAEVDR